MCKTKLTKKDQQEQKKNSALYELTQILGGKQDTIYITEVSNTKINLNLFYSYNDTIKKYNLNKLVSTILNLKLDKNGCIKLLFSVTDAKHEIKEQLDLYIKDKNIKINTNIFTEARYL